MRTLTIATRGSQLALWQANYIKTILSALEPEREISLKVIKTHGDKILDVPLAQVGGKGLFVKEIEEALLDGSADLAVHSIKDVPMELPESLVLGCIPQREDFTDSFLSEKYTCLEELPQGAKVGTSSLRRQSQLLALRPDLVIESLRGNVDTRLRKLQEGQFDAIILASAGLKRLNLSARYSVAFNPDKLVPAVGQGALGIECRSNDEEVLSLIKKIEDRETRICVEAERAFLRELDGGCQVPIGAHATLQDKGHILYLDGIVGELDGSHLYRSTMQGNPNNPQELGKKLGHLIKASGADKVLESIYEA